MVDSYRVIDIQIYKKSQWTSYYKTFDDKNVIYRIYSLIKSQIKGHKLRIIDHSLFINKKYVKFLLNNFYFRI